MSRQAGSSPLARGLRLHLPLAPAPARIIPARAGFTDASKLRGLSPQDHPRSRGVYWYGAQGALGIKGSSPLARGLHEREADDSGPGGIIPARAGFTSSRPRACRSCKDHPRSRGVYAMSACDQTTSPGSSPLARGLQRQKQRLHRQYRIIPARAGFTSLVRAMLSHLPDHPRSRGVYRHSMHTHGNRNGIIPARAGFTGRVRRRDRHGRDHPRSRGVYGC